MEDLPADRSMTSKEDVMHPYLLQSLETAQASDRLDVTDSAQKRMLVITAARAILRMHAELGIDLAQNELRRGHIVYDLAELATLIDDGVPDHVVASGLKEAAEVMASLCHLLTENAAAE
ncbi:hypothetical protein J5277_09975 [Rhizobium sp. 16-449-1b]|uniref:hypothetical protein n=1 Tax=Rhizobium sp. 16-449-1b TaxID=2819989 RepID=UPI001ADA70D3|nr:hypothetical protein [Rhizobium sp. 16-449-1b]MBO9194434.1 hypothetical protein [Rhizobium sp. 16-449-1b]